MAPLLQIVSYFKIFLDYNKIIREVFGPSVLSELYIILINLQASLKVFHTQHCAILVCLPHYTCPLHRSTCDHPSPPLSCTHGPPWTGWYLWHLYKSSQHFPMLKNLKKCVFWKHCLVMLTVCPAWLWDGCM